MTTLTLQPAEAAAIDTYVNKVSANTNYVSALVIGIRGYNTTKENGLLKFDLSSLAGATISSATLYLYGNGSANDGTINIFRILVANSAWTEAGATWNYAVASSVRWAGDTGANGGDDAGCDVSGTDYSSTRMGQMAFSHTAGAEASVALDLAEFGLMVANNYGMILKDNGTANAEKQAGSSSDTTEARRPKLVVEYTSGCPKMTMHYAKMRSDRR